MSNRIPLIIVSVMAMCLLAYCSLGRSVQSIIILPDNLPPSSVSVDQLIKISYVIKNTGGRAIAGPASVTSDKMAVTCPPLNTIGDLDGSLDRSEEIRCSGDYQVKAADLQAGGVPITASATVGNVVSSPVTAKLTPVYNGVLPASSLRLTTSANPSTYSQAGQQVTINYVIQNTGSANLGPYQFTVKDNLINAAPFNCGPANTILAPGTTVTCIAPYTVTQNDITAVSITNIATAADGAGGASAPASTTVSRVNDTQHEVREGEWLWQIARCYGVNPNTLVAENESLVPNPTLLQRGTVLTIRNPGTYSTYHGPPCVESHTVQVGDTWNSIAQKSNADPVILQMANPSKTLSPGTVVYVPRNSGSGNISPSTQIKTLSLTTTVNPTTYDQAGQAITFTYVIRNSGNVSLGPDQFKVTDILISATPFNCGAANTTLAPNTTATCQAMYTTTQNDMSAVSITNIVTASGGGAAPSPEASATVNKSVRSLALTAAASPSTYNQANQTITFAYEIRNTGNVSLGPTQFTVSDSLISAAPFNCGGVNTILAPNVTITCQATYTINQNDMSAVSITNIATASGGGAGPSPFASVTVNKR